MRWHRSPSRTSVARRPRRHAGIVRKLPGVLAAAATVLLVGPRAGVAQDVGDRVRVVLVGETLIGQVSGVQDDGFRMTLPDGASRTVRRGEVRWLERDVADGTNAIPWATKGLARGALGGAAIGFLLGMAVGPECLESECRFTVAERARAGAQYGLGYAGIGGVFGGVTGLILGSRSQRDDWQVIALPQGAGLMVGVRLRF